MNCQEITSLIDAYFDRELDLVRSLEIEKHLETCASCARELRQRQTLRTTLQSTRLTRPAPESLRHWALSQNHPKVTSSPDLSWWDFKNWLPAGSMAAALAILYIGIAVVSRSSEEHRLAQDIVSAHVRSLMASHLTDVTSTNQHTVKPWFNGKIDFAPSVRDLSEYSFPLIGGRLDYLAQRSVAALVYQRQQHLINLFIWPDSKGKDRSLHVLTERGYNLLTWTKSGMSYWAVSDLNSQELQEFGQIIQTQANLPLPLERHTMN